MIYTTKQILENFESILYKELNVKKNYHEIDQSYCEASYSIDATNSTNINKTSFILLVGIIKRKDKIIDIDIVITNNLNQLIFEYNYHYNENEISQFFLNAQKILRLVNVKLSNTEIRNFYQTEGLVVDTNREIEIPNDNNFDQAYSTMPRSDIIFSSQYIKTKRELLFFKTIQLVKKYIKEEYKNKIYAENDLAYLKILDTGKIVVALDIYFNNNEPLDKAIIVKIIIKWDFTNIQLMPYKYLSFKAKVSAISNNNEEEILNKLTRKAMLFFNELDDYINLK